MYNLDDIAKIYFKYTTPNEVINDIVRHNDYARTVFLNKALMHMTYYSDTENAGLYDYASGNLHIDRYSSKEKKADVFETLAVLADELLVMNGNQVVCKYSEFIRWRNVTTYIGETGLICAFLANRSRRGMGETQSFLWDITIGHNNVQLNRLVGAGVSENHFHLFGSAPIFDLTWIRLMNHVCDRQNMKALVEIGKKRRESHKNNYNGGEKLPLEQEYLRAALIRVYLAIVMLDGENKLKAKELLEAYHYNNKKILYLLQNPELLYDEISNIQNLIGDLKCILESGKKGIEIDYALYAPKGSTRGNASANEIFSGDRWLIYRILEGKLKKEGHDILYKLLYAYMLIKVDIRSEILQVNNTIGFENFSIYSNRKNGFLYKQSDMKNMIQGAIYGSIQTGNIKCLEIRVTPKESAKETAEMILTYDRIIKENEAFAIKGCKTYYVIHFTKRADEIPQKCDYFGTEYRHYKKRRQLKKQAEAIKVFREGYPGTAQRLLGIDACSQEIRCRPEVFASIFRRLGQHIVAEESEYKIKQLRKTYHVGEDFLDIVDGLRAVDEAIRFLKLGCGDRIGHGTVLGINVKKWYEIKRNTIIIPVQDYLDNIVWMYHKLIEFKVIGVEELKNYLLREFETYFSEFYEPYMSRLKIDEICESMPRNIEYKKRVYQFNIHNYYDAWKLRGDEPQIYGNGYMDINVLRELGEDAIDIGTADSIKVRKNFECTLLYYFYHYSLEIRTVGAQSREIYIPKFYIDGAVKLQKAMQEFVGIKGIGIETNPTSNLLISTMTGYNEHPILNFYNKDLTLDFDAVNNCQQLYVSINTDDKGVFRTSLENEYALLACSMEKVKDSEGKHLYNRQMVYEWLEHIRVMGNRQSFLTGDEV